MKKVYWVTGGIVIVSAVFFIPDPAGDIWTSVWLSSTAAFLYLIVLAWIWLKQIRSKGRRMAIGIILGLLVLSSGMYGYFIHKRSQLTSTVLPQTKLNIEQSTAQAYIMEPFLSTMETYFMSEEERSEQHSLSAIFTSKYDSLLTDDNVFQYGSGVHNRSLNLYLADAKPESVVIIGQSEIVDGEDPEFENYDGSTGKMQVRGILTPNGIHYERQN